MVLALFLPLIISSGGNSGSQATTLVIRAMALGELRLRDWLRVVRREVATGLALGSILGLIGISRILVWQSLRGTYGAHYLVIALTIGCSLVGVVLFGTLAGSMLPVHPAPLRTRSRQRFGPVCRHSGGRHRPDDLLHGGQLYLTRDPVVKRVGMQRREFCAGGLLAAGAALAGSEEGFRPLFDGVSLQGWQRKPRSAAKPSLGKWTVEDGVIIGGQDPVGVGALPAVG